MARSYYQGFYQVQNKGKYRGDFNKVVFRSSWELLVFKWCDSNPQVIKWCSEENIVPYICKTDGKAHRYFVDLCVEFKNGKKYFVEIKPKKDTIKPVNKAGKRKSVLMEEVLTWVKNDCKWKAAEHYAKAKGGEFKIWTEDTLRSLGIRMLNESRK